MTTIRTMTLAWALASALLACGRGKVDAPPEPVVTAGMEEEPGKVRAEEVVTVSATVQDIDLKSREVTLVRADGEEIVFTAGPDVRNLDRVRRGDVVGVTYYQSLALDLRKAGKAETGVQQAEGVERSQPGEKPGGVVAESTKITAEIVRIDKKNNTISLKGPRGYTRTFPVRNPKHLDEAKVGDFVELTYTEAIGIKVEPPAK